MRSRAYCGELKAQPATYLPGIFQISVMYNLGISNFVVYSNELGKGYIGNQNAIEIKYLIS